jgi:hypothetical protein
MRSKRTLCVWRREGGGEEGKERKIRGEVEKNACFSKSVL